MIKKELVLHEMYDVKKSTATSETDPLFKLGWDQVKENLSAIYSIANEQEIKVALLIFPYTFQLFNRSLKNPKRILTQHAR